MKFNPDLIQKARNGEIAILNDGSVEELQKLIDYAAPHCVKPDGGSTFYFISKNGGWSQSKFNGYDLPAHSVKDFFMPDTYYPDKKEPEIKIHPMGETVLVDVVDQPRTYKVTRGQMKEIWEAIEPAYQEYFIDVMKGRFGHFNNEGELYKGDVESLCEAAPKELLQKIFPEYFYIPEGEPVLARDNLGSWVIGVSDGKGKAYVTFNYNHAQSYDQIIPFTKNPPQ